MPAWPGEEAPEARCEAHATVAPQDLKEWLGKAANDDARLWEADLASQDLRKANLRGASLRGADLEDADLRGADLSESDRRKVFGENAVRFYGLQKAMGVDG